MIRFNIYTIYKHKTTNTVIHSVLAVLVLHDTHLGVVSFQMIHNLFVPPFSYFRSDFYLFCFMAFTISFINLYDPDFFIPLTKTSKTCL